MSLSWTAARWPERAPLIGTTARLEPLDPERHGRSLFNASHDDGVGDALFRHLPYGPFGGFDEFTTWLDERAASTDPLFFAIVDVATDTPRGMASFLRIVPEHGVIEIGHIWFSPSLQRTRAATEAIYLMAAIRLRRPRLSPPGVEVRRPQRRVSPRRRALRLHVYEGVFRQHLVVKGRNRDTAWYSMLDGEWPRIRTAFEAWLAPANFDATGKQMSSLAAIREAIP